MNQVQEKNASSPRKMPSRQAWMSLSIYVLAFFSTLLILVLLILRLPFFTENQVIKLNLDSGTQGKLSLVLSKEEAQHYYPLSEKLLLRVGQTTSAFVNTEGKEELSVDLGFDQIRLKENQGYFVATEAQSPRYMVFNKKGLLYAGKTNLSILAAAISPTGKLALLLDDVDSQSYVQVFNEDGTENFDMILRDEQSSGYVVDMHFSADDSELYLTKLNLASATPRPLITSYSLKDSNMTEIQAEYKPKLSLVAFIESTLNHQILLFASTEVMHIDQGELLSKIQYANLYTGGITQNLAYVIATKNEGGLYYLKTWDVYNSEPEDLENYDYVFSGLPLQIDVHGKYMAVLQGKEILRFDLSRPAQPQSFKLDAQILRMRMNENGSLLLVTEDGIREILE